MIVRVRRVDAARAFAGVGIDSMTAGESAIMCRTKGVVPVMRLVEELKRRNVIRVAIGYLAVGWLLLQAGSLIFGALDLPNSWVRGLLALLAVGFIPTLIFAWVYELTPEGLKRTSEVSTEESVSHLTGRKLDYIVIGVLAAVVALLLVDKFVVAPWQTARTHAAESATAAAAPPVAGEGATATTPPADSIAVLPFVDMSQAKDQEYFSDGLSEELLDLLAKVPQLKVIARTSSFSFKGKNADVAEIAKKLAVATVLEGSVRKSGNTLRVTAQLIRTIDSTHLWSETYDRELTDIFKVQDEIASAVVAALKLKLLPSQAAAGNQHRTANLDAYNEYLIGKQEFSRNNVDGWRHAEAGFRRSVALDPSYAPAWAGLADTLNFLSDFLDGADAIAAAKHEALAAADKAVALAPDLAEGYMARGQLRYTTFWDWTGAQADIERAMLLEPNSSESRFQRAELLATLGRLAEAIAEIRKAVELDPLSPKAWSSLGWELAATGRLAEAREAAQRAVALNSESSFALVTVAIVELLEGNFEATRISLKRGGDNWDRMGSALIEHSLGHKDAAQAALNTLIAKDADGSAYQIAEVFAWRGEPDSAFEWLDRAYRQHDGGLANLMIDPLLKSLRSDARFAAFEKKMGLTQ